MSLGVGTDLGPGTESEAGTLGFSSPDLEFSSDRDKILEESAQYVLSNSMSNNMCSIIYCHILSF